MRRIPACLCVILLMTAATSIGAPAESLPGVDVAGPKPSVMILGTFHFANPNLDVVKGTADDMLSEKRQAEILDLVRRLKAFAPTKIALEAPPGDTVIEAEYPHYRIGTYTLTANETDQIGYRLAKELKHERVYGIDYPQEMDIEGAMKFAGAHGQQAQVDRLQTAFAAISVKMDAWSKLPLLDQIRRHNDPAIQDSLHRAYLLLAEIGVGGETPGTNAVAGWYERNLRIAMNIVHLASSPSDKVLVIIGSGHVKLLNDYLGDSPSVDLVPAAKYLAATP